MKNTIIELKNLTKIFDNETVVNNINLTIEEGDFVTLLGPSGCGKTTILRMIGGFETPTSGEILLYGKDLSVIEAYKRPINTVFQNYALFTHMNVFENIAFSMRIKKQEEEAIKKTVRELLKVVDLAGYEKRRINELSGGQQQRVAIARALANNPKVLLLDEPLSALDAKLRKEMQVELKRIQQSVNITFIYVTHDQEEALSLSDKIIVMQKGEIQQMGTPVDIYNEPANEYVANFVGQSNIIDGIMTKDLSVKFLNHTFVCVDPKPIDTNNVKVVIRPEDIVPMHTTHKKHLDGVVTSATFKGVHYELLVDVKEYTFLVQTTKKFEEGDSIALLIDPDSIHIMRGEVNAQKA